MKASKRSYRFKRAVRPKVKKKRLRYIVYAGSAAIMVVLFISAAVKFAPYIIGSLKKVSFNPAAQAQLTVKNGEASMEFSIESPFPEITHDVKSFLEEKLEKDISLDQALELALIRFPYIKEIATKKRRFGKELTLSTVLKEPVLLSGQMCMDPEGGFFKCYGEYLPSENMKVMCENKECIAQMPEKLVELLKALKKETKKFPADISAINIEKAGKVYVKLIEGTVIKWGSYGFFNDKVYRLDQVYYQSLTKKTVPLYIDMSYFEYGKIVVKALEDGGSDAKK